MLDKLHIDKKEISKGGAKDIEERICAAYPAVTGRAKGFDALKNLNAGLGRSIEKLAEDIGIGTPTLKDIIDEIKKPGRDPRDEAPAVIFRNDVRSFEGSSRSTWSLRVLSET